MKPVEIMYSVGLVIEYLLQKGGPDDRMPPRLYQHELLDIVGKRGEAETLNVLNGILVMLTAQGLLIQDEDCYLPTSRNAYFALASLAKFLLSQTPVISSTPVNHVERFYFLEITKALEQIRKSRQDIDSQPIHHRRIVNVLIKSQQTRNGRKQEVYLHVYHHSWKAYHLIGLSKKQDYESDDDLAIKALGYHLRMSNSDFEIDKTFKPRELKVTELSETSGALTEYTFSLARVDSFKKRLALKEIVSDSQSDEIHGTSQPRLTRDTFRWFTEAEMLRGSGDSGEKIIFSSAHLIQEYKLDQTSVNAPGADDIRPSIGLMIEVRNRITYLNMVFVLMAIAIGIATAYFSGDILSFLGTQNTLLDNLVKVLGIAFSTINTYIAYRRLNS